MSARAIPLLFALFAVSGFTGLIYESVWSHYLKLFLGAAAFAQSFVLAAFMGGMAIGAWLISRRASRLANPLALYGWIEGLIGLLALIFHEAYVALTDFSSDHILPLLGAADLVPPFKYLLSGLLIVPQTILLGMTFPLLSGAVIRREPNTSGHHLSVLYFSNSLGAAIGALTATFLLLGWLGMPGTMRLAGIINVALAAVVLYIAHGSRDTAPVFTAANTRTVAAGRTNIVRLFLIGALITGLASFIYELTWIRMLSLVLGGSFHAFEVMLAAFITGLALGGFWIRNRIDYIEDPVRFAGIAQVLMGIAALSTILIYHYTFDWMLWAQGAIQRKESTYPLFMLFSNGIAFLVMIPATFFAGMVLPLFTRVLMQTGAGERAIGQIYAANTLGAIIGALATTHLLLPMLGLKLALSVGAFFDILLGVWLLRKAPSPSSRKYTFAAVAVGLFAAWFVGQRQWLDPNRLSSGVFRPGHSYTDDEIIFYRDGKSASIALRLGPGGLVSLRTNGKPDAGLPISTGGPVHLDEHTMILTGAIPVLLKGGSPSVANIGFGSGLTSETVLSHRGVKSLDNVELEPAVIEAARTLTTRISLPFTDLRSRIHYEDAKTHFARITKMYDVIISEPSNPWVNGVASLFTTEFYQSVKKRLAPSGLFAQWIQLYEFNEDLLAVIVAALDENFADYEAYLMNNSDLLIVAVAIGNVPALGPLPDEPALRKHLARIGVAQTEDIVARRIGNRKSLAPLVRAKGKAPNSDYYPAVQLKAPKAMFLAQQVSSLPELAAAPLPVMEMLHRLPSSEVSVPRQAATVSLPLIARANAVTWANAVIDKQASAYPTESAEMSLNILAFKQPGFLCGNKPSDLERAILHMAAQSSLSHLPFDLRKSIWIDRVWLTCKFDWLSPVVREQLDIYALIAARDAGGMMKFANAALEKPENFQRTDWRKYLLSVAMLGAAASGKTTDASLIWDTHGKRLYQGDPMPPHLQYLLD